MKIAIATTLEQASQYAALVVREFFMTPDPVRLGLATGETMISVYHYLVQQLSDSVPPANPRVTTFNLDEYWPVSPDQSGSFRYFMNRYLFSQAADFLDKVHFLQGNGDDPEGECQRFDQILSEEPLDLQLLGIGVNGHIGFNEPGTPRTSRTHKVMLSPSTMERNRSQFPGPFPTQALSMGIANIMEAKRIVLVAFGSAKQEIMRRAFSGPVTEDCPASILQTHEDVTIVADMEAAQGLLTALDVTESSLHYRHGVARFDWSAVSKLP